MRCPRFMEHMTKKKKKQKPKSWVDVFQSERKEFPQGYCVTRIIPDKRRNPSKHKKKELEENES